MQLFGNIETPKQGNNVGGLFGYWERLQLSSILKLAWDHKHPYITLSLKFISTGKEHCREQKC